MKMANDLCDEDYKQYDSLSPHGELARGSLKITINDKQLTTITLRHQRISEVVMWMIRQKQNLDAYMAEWEDVLKKSSKKTKSNRVSLLAIKAIFTQSMKDYPGLEYVFIEQKRRMRIRVKLPNSQLGVYLDAWWGSYRQKLPQQIDDLKSPHPGTQQLQHQILLHHNPLNPITS